MITVSQLDGYQPGFWRIAATAFEQTGRDLMTQAKDLRASAASTRTHWSDQTGAMIADRMEEQADASERAAPVFDQAAVIIRTATDEMEQCQTDLRTILAWLDPQPLSVSDTGVVTLGFLARLKPPRVQVVLGQRAQTATVMIQRLLVRASMADARAASALGALSDLDLPYVDGGPLDLSDAGIAAQARDNRQGQYGFCAYLTPLMSIGRADPDLIRRNMQWDPQTRTYTVTLHDPDTGEPVQVQVDPEQIPDGGSEGPGGEPTYLSVYEEALRQQYPDIDDTNFPEATKIITGESAEERPATDTDFDEIQTTMDDGGAVMAATPGAAEPQPADVPDDKRLVQGHAYSVAGIDDQGRIILENPWGPQGGYDSNGNFCPGEVRLTEDEYRRWIGGVGQLEDPS